MKRRDFLKLGVGVGALVLLPRGVWTQEERFLISGASEGEEGEALSAESEALEGETLEGLDEDVKRSVHSQEEGKDWKGVVFHGKRESRRIAITLDDGPSVYTPEYLDIFHQYRVPCTFFLIGKSVRRNDPGFYHRYLSEGHEVANHTWSHENISRKGPKEVREQLLRAQNRIEEKMGMKPELFRPPYGRLSTHSAGYVKETRDFKAIVMWDVDPVDWKRPGWRTITNNVLKNAKGGSIVLSHDNHAQALKSLPILIDYLHLQGYEFVTVSELLFNRKARA